MTPLIAWPLRARLYSAVFLGVLAATGLQPFGFWYVSMVSFALVPMLLGGARSAPEAGWTGWAFGLGYFGLGLAWIVEPFLVDLARHGWMAPFALLFMAGGLSLFWAAAFWGAWRFGAGMPGQITALVAFWTGAEALRAFVLTGFPWAAPGQVWVGTDVAQLLAFVGPDGLNLVTFAICLPIALILVPKSTAASRVISLVPALCIMALVPTVLRPPLDVVMTDQLVRLVQPNAPQHQKWDPDYIPEFFRRQVDFTGRAPHVDLVVWPEASLANHVNGVADPLAQITQAAAGSRVALGVLRPDSDGFYNSLVKLDENGAISGVYDKHHLVPFGEYLPFGDVLEQFGLAALARVVPSGMKAGPGPALLDFGALGRAVPLICYEAVFAPLLRRTPERADFLLQITNDAWFGEWSGPYQHLAQAQMRAIEQGLPMVRVANTGVSAMIDPYGRITGHIPLGEAGFLDRALPAPVVATFYATYGGLPSILATIALLFCVFAQRMALSHANRD